MAKRVERSANYQRAIMFADRHSIESNSIILSQMPRVTIVKEVHSQSKLQDEDRASRDAQGASTSRPSNSADVMSTEVGDADEPSLQSNEPTRASASGEQRQSEAHAAPSCDKASTSVQDATRESEVSSSRLLMARHGDEQRPYLGLSLGLCLCIELRIVLAKCTRHSASRALGPCTYARLPLRSSRSFVALPSAEAV